MNKSYLKYSTINISIITMYSAGFSFQNTYEFRKYKNEKMNSLN